MRGSLLRALAVASCVLTLSTAASTTDAQQIRFLEIDAQEAGLFPARDLGFPERLWNGSTREGLAAAYDEIPELVAIPAAYHALRDLLIARATLPPGPNLDPPLISRRVAALARLGATEETVSLASRAPEQFRDAQLLDAEASARLLRFDLSGACNLSQSSRVTESTASWQRLRAFCRQVYGQQEEATVAAVLAEELSRRPDDAFAALLLAMQYPTRPKPSNLLPADPLQLAMLRFQRLSLASTAQLDETPAPVLAGLLRTPNLPASLRLQAAELAVKANVSPADPLLQLYFETSYPGGVGEAYRNAAYAGPAEARRTALQLLWIEARKAGLLTQLAPYTLAVASGLEVNNPSPAFLHDALHVALLADDPAAIRTWREASKAAANTLVGERERNRSYALLALAGETMPPPERWWGDWVAAAKPTDAQQQLVGGVLGAFGLGFPLAPSPAITRTSATAGALDAAERAPAEAALRALAALAQEPEPDIGLQVLAVRSLARIHPGHAHALAVELAVAAGI
jgi:hypothetical protein